MTTNTECRACGTRIAPGMRWCDHHRVPANRSTAALRREFGPCAMGGCSNHATAGRMLCRDHRYGATWADHQARHTA